MVIGLDNTEVIAALERAVSVDCWGKARWEYTEECLKQ